MDGKWQNTGQGREAEAAGVGATWVGPARLTIVRNESKLWAGDWPGNLGTPALTKEKATDFPFVGAV